MAQFCNLFQHGSSGPRAFCSGGGGGGLGSYITRQTRAARSRNPLAAAVSHRQRYTQRYILASTFRWRLTCATQVVRSNTEPTPAMMVFSAFLATSAFLFHRGENAKRKHLA